MASRAFLSLVRIQRILFMFEGAVIVDLKLYSTLSPTPVSSQLIALNKSVSILSITNIILFPCRFHDFIFHQFFMACKVYPLNAHCDFTLVSCSLFQASTTFHLAGQRQAQHDSSNASPLQSTSGQQSCRNVHFNLSSRLPGTWISLL